MTYDEFPITAANNFKRAVNILNQVENEAEYYVYFYAALEFRYCIERLLIEYLFMLKCEALSKSRIKLYKADKIVMSILNDEPQFFDKLQFINFYCEVLGLKERVYCLKRDKFDKIKKIYFDLSNYLHAIKNQELDEYFNSLEKLLNVAKDELNPIFQKNIGFISLSEKGLELFDKLMKGEINYDQARDQIIKDNEGK